MNKRKAIKLLGEQKDKLDKSPSMDVWRSQTKSLLQAIFGEESTEYKWLRDFHIPNYVGVQVSKLEKIKKDRYIEFLNGCIETVKNRGVYQKPKINFLERFDNPTLVTIIIFSLGVVFSGGMLLGKYLAEVNNLELRREVKELQQQNTTLENQIKALQEKETSD